MFANFFQFLNIIITNFKLSSYKESIYMFGILFLITFLLVFLAISIYKKKWASNCDKHKLILICIYIALPIFVINLFIVNFIYVDLYTFQNIDLNRNIDYDKLDNNKIVLYKLNKLVSDLEKLKVTSNLNNLGKRFEKDTVNNKLRKIENELNNISNTKDENTKQINDIIKNNQANYNREKLIIKLVKFDDLLKHNKYSIIRDSINNLINNLITKEIITEINQMKTYLNRKENFDKNSVIDKLQKLINRYSYKEDLKIVQNITEMCNVIKKANDIKKNKVINKLSLATTTDEYKYIDANADLMYSLSRIVRYSNDSLDISNNINRKQLDAYILKTNKIIKDFKESYTIREIDYISTYVIISLIIYFVLHIKLIINYLLKFDFEDFIRGVIVFEYLLFFVSYIFYAKFYIQFYKYAENIQNYNSSYIKDYSYSNFVIIILLLLGIGILYYIYKLEEKKRGEKWDAIGILNRCKVLFKIMDKKMLYNLFLSIVLFLSLVFGVVMQFVY